MILTGSGSGPTANLSITDDESSNFLYTVGAALFISYYVTNHNMFRPHWVIIRCHLLHTHNYQTAAHTHVFLQFGKI
jgi:hypothetical protein